jgi:hypothetical protein
MMRTCLRILLDLSQKVGGLEAAERESACLVHMKKRQVMEADIGIL